MNSLNSLSLSPSNPGPTWDVSEAYVSDEWLDPGGKGMVFEHVLLFFNSSLSILLQILWVCLVVLQGLLSFLSAPLIGALSDVWGRKSFLLLTVFFTCAPIPLMKISPWYDGSQPERVHSYWEHHFKSWIKCIINWVPYPASGFRWYFAVISVSGVFAVTFSVVFAYVADITQEHERSMAYGLVCIRHYLHNLF